MADENKPSTPPEGAAPDAPKPAPAAAQPAAPAVEAKPAAAVPPKPPAAPPKPAGPTPQPLDTELTRRLKQHYGTGLEALSYVGQNYLVVDHDIIHDVLHLLRDDEAFDYCVDVTAVHYPKNEKPFEVVYILYSFPKNERIRVKTSIAEGEAIPTVSDLWVTADWLEREVFDMFGITFAGHPNLKRILLPDGWKGYPLRKDYPILLQDKEWVQINLGIESGQ
jgi:NADH-quinone oxidoreductase subunit C